MIVIFIWQKLINVEHKKMLIVRNFWQLVSRIFGETLHVLSPISWTYRIVQYRYSSRVHHFLLLGKQEVAVKLYFSRAISVFSTGKWCSSAWRTSHRRSL